VGVAPSLATFDRKYGLRGACISTVALVRGVGRFCGLKVIGSNPSTSVEELIKTALDAMENYDFILLNIKSPDDASHDGDPQKKIDAIEEIDRAADKLHYFVQENYNYLAIISDHTSSTTRKDHCGDPVPIVIGGPEVRTDDVTAFSERLTSKGGLCRLRGTDVMNILVDLMNKSAKFGA
jgi:2,3-bisphosphoglycerate-independent phosphoglycerate mutase